MAVRNKLEEEEIREEVRKRYANMATRQSEVGSASCCAPANASADETSCCSPNLDATDLLYNIPEIEGLPQEVRSLSAGCGDPITLADLQPGQDVLDLGSGGGIDCFLAAKKVGPKGSVIGVDMTPEMLTKARGNKERIGAENVDFRLGEIEHLPVADESIDVIISNCVINLSTDKTQVFREAYRVLRSGGKVAVSDIVADGPLPEQLQGNMASWACCIAGAMDQQDFLEALEHVGFTDVRIVPQTLDENLVSDFLGEGMVELSENAEQKPRININGKWETLDLSKRKLPFSARITARKP